MTFPRTILTTVALTVGLMGGVARAEVSLVKVATQIGLSYLPLIIMQHDKLWEKEARDRGVIITADYITLGGGAALNDALLSDSVHLVAGGLAPLLVLWDRTKSNYKVKGVSAVSAGPIDLLTNDPKVKSIRDFGPDAKIAVASIKVSYQAILLAMLAEKELGKSDALDGNQVAMAHPEAYAALTTRSGAISGYLSSIPFQERALMQPGIFKLTDSLKIVGEPTSLGVLYAKSDFINNNPTLVAAFLAAQQKAAEMIKADPKRAIDEYLEITGDKTERSLLDSILASGELDFEMQPKGTLTIARFMKKIGLLKAAPASWKEYFFNTVTNGQGG
jgi:NitT/TauT family transport system substrate-binding protein